MKQGKLYPATEVMSVLLSDSIKGDKEMQNEWKADPHDMLLQTLNVEIDKGIDINFVHNDAHQIALVLPYHSAIDEFHVRQLSTEEIDDIAGGIEVVFAVGGFFGTIGVAMGVGVPLLTHLGFSKAAVAAGAAVVLGPIAAGGLLAAAGATTGGVVGHQASKK